MVCFVSKNAGNKTFKGSAVDYGMSSNKTLDAGFIMAGTGRSFKLRRFRRLAHLGKAGSRPPEGS
jgi:hypothetical protein